MTQDRLRVAMLVEDADVPAWLAALAARLAAAPTVDLEVYAAGRRKRGVRRPILLPVYERIDGALFRSRPDAFARVAIEVREPPESFAGRDVVLDFASLEPQAHAAGVRFGVWVLTNELDHGPPSEGVYRMQIEAVFAERRVAVHTSRGAVDGASLARTRNRALWGAQAAFAHRLETVRRLGESYVESRSGDAVEPPSRRPSNRGVARYAVAAAVGVVGRRCRALRTREAWFVATRRRGEAPTPGSPAGFEPLALPRAGVADPFVIDRDGASFLFFEDDDPGTGKGHISYTRLDPEDEAMSEPETVLTAPYHLSYPFVFEHEGEVFMIPESSASERVELYRADPFPSRWTLAHVLLEDVRALDPTLHIEGDRLWLFAAVTEEGASPNDDLHLFSSRSLTGPWQPHPANPVVSDARSARPAGRIFRRGTELMRPSQDCSRRYGYAVVFNRIDVLAEDEYRETPVGRIDPTWYPGIFATHTYNFDSRVEVIDGKRLVAKRRR